MRASFFQQGCCEASVQISEQAFWVKMLGLGTVAGYAILYLAVKLARGGMVSLIGPQNVERQLLLDGVITLEQLQRGPWHANTQKVSTYGVFSLGTLIASVSYIFSQELKSWDLHIFQLLLFILGLSVLSYFVSLQFWFLALDAGRPALLSLAFRRKATMLQTMGWFMTQIAGTIAILTVSTPLGWIFGLLATAGIIFVYDHKAHLYDLHGQ